MLIYENGNFDIVSFNLTVKFYANHEKIIWEAHSFKNQEYYYELVEKYK